MTHRPWIALAAAALLSACTTPEELVINDAAEALGGRDGILAVQRLLIEGEGTNGNFGQDMTPEATGQTFTVSGYRRALDVAGGRVRIEQTRTPNFPYFQGQEPQTQVLGLDGDVAYNIAPNGNATRAANAVAQARRAELYHHPITIMRAALDPAATLSNAHRFSSERIADLMTADGVALTLAIDGVTGLPTRVTSMTDNTVLGDITIETSFADYQDVGGLQLPTTLTTRTDQYVTAELRVTNQAVDGDVGDLAAPAAAASAEPITGPPPANVTVTEVDNGVWLLGGQSHNSVLVEFADHLTLIEAPQNETRTLAVIARARELRPNKPLSDMINTHHHFDHSGGMRAAVSEGLTVYTHRANGTFYQDVVGRQHTLAPDALARNPRPMNIQLVSDELILSDATKRIVLYPISDSPHASTLLMVYFPVELLLVEADVFNPGSPVAPFAANLLENVRRRNLRVGRIVPIHGGITPFAELVRTASAAAAR